MIALSQTQMDTILHRARRIHDPDQRQRFFDADAAALRKLDPPLRDYDVTRAATDAFAPYNLALSPRAKSSSATSP